MRRILAMMGVLALVVAFSMPMMAEAASHKGGDKKNPCNPCAAKAKNPCNPCNPCAAKAKAEKKMDEAKDAGKKAMDKKK